MSTIRVDLSPKEPAAEPGEPGKGTRGLCGNCGFADTGTYCSRCGEPLHGTRETVLQILWGELVEGPVHNAFALVKTTWLMLARPRRFFDAALRRQHGMTHVPFFLSPLWKRISHRPHGVPNAVKYFVLIYTLSVLGAWVVGVNGVNEITNLFRAGAVLHDLIAEALFLAFVVFAAGTYAKAMAMLLGGKVATDLLTRFMLYLNGLALIPFTGMSMAGTRHPVLFVACLGFWIYVLFVLPQLALPRIFGISRTRLGFAQGAATLVNLAGLVVLFFCATFAADRLDPRWSDPAFRQINAVRDAGMHVLPVDTVVTAIENLPRMPLPPGVPLNAIEVAPGGRHAPAAQPAR